MLGHSVIAETPIGALPGATGGAINVLPDALDFALSFDGVATTLTKTATVQALDFATTFDNALVVRAVFPADMLFGTTLESPNVLRTQIPVPADMLFDVTFDHVSATIQVTGRTFGPALQ